MVNEELNTDEKGIADMLGALPRVGVPGDFDFRVKARIAQGVSAVSGRSWLLSISRFAVPAILLLFVGGYLGFRSMDASSRDASVAIEAKPVNTVPALPPAANVESIERPKDLKAGLAPVKSKDVDPRLTTTVSDAIVPTPKSVDTGGGSLERGLGASRTVYPRGVDPNAKAPTVPKEFNQPGKVSAKDVLNLLGVEVIYLPNGWKVSNVAANSAAQRAGLKSGDVVEAINDQPVSERTTFKGIFTSKSVRVRREDKVVEIDLQKP